MSAPLSPQSYAFINPTGQALGYLIVGKATSSFLTFGIVAALGVMVGSFLWALFTRGLRFKWFPSFKDFYTHVIGAILMGFGGVLVWAAHKDRESLASRLSQQAVSHSNINHHR